MVYCSRRIRYTISDMNDIEKSIIKTLAFSAAIGRALTRAELWAELYAPSLAVDKESFEEALDTLLRAREVIREGAFFRLRDTTYDWFDRIRKTTIADKKIRRAYRIVGVVSKLPFVRAIFVCNTVAFGTAETSSDIDFFVVTAPRRIWTARFFMIMVAAICGWRPSPRRVRDQACFSFFVDEKHLDLGKWRIVPDDIYLAYWLTNLLPLYDPRNIFTRLQAENRWCHELLPNTSQTYCAGKNWQVLQSRSLFGRKPLLENILGGKLGDWKEKYLALLQGRFIKKNFSTYLSQSQNAVVVSDGVLKFHANDRRMEIYEKWKKICLDYIR